MEGCNGGSGGVNSFALVFYIPDPLGAFLDRLRNELVTECHAKAHVTVLPPRPLACSTPEAWNALQERTLEVPPFRVELGAIEVFPVTDVIYISVKAGQGELQKIHTALNAGCLSFREPFLYHPHVTLAQQLKHDQITDAAELAIGRWAEFKGSKSFTVDKLTFVQNTADNCWQDLNAIPLSAIVAR
jgi:2'-5' RNA ligase